MHNVMLSYKMVSVIGEEFVAYSTSTSGNVPANIPLVALLRYDKDEGIEIRDLKKQDIPRIAPLSSSLIGGWLFRLSQSDASFSSSWVKRFVIIQGELVRQSLKKKEIQLLSPLYTTDYYRHFYFIPQLMISLSHCYVLEVVQLLCHLRTQQGLNNNFRVAIPFEPIQALSLTYDTYLDQPFASVHPPPLSANHG